MASDPRGQDGDSYDIMQIQEIVFIWVVIFLLFFTNRVLHGENHSYVYSSLI